MSFTRSDIEEQYQNVVENELTEDLTLDPKKPTRYYVSNIFQRVFSALFGWYGKELKRIKCTSAGELRVATTGAPVSNNDTHSGNAPDTYGTPIQFDDVAIRVDIFVFDNPAIIKRTPDGTTWNDEIEIPANSMYSIDASTHSINIRNKTAGSIARYQIVGWF